MNWKINKKNAGLFRWVIAALLGGLLFGSSAPASSAQNLTQTSFDDGTGSIGLPPGWQIDGAYRGSVECTGPNGSGVYLGIPWTIVIPGDPVTSLPGVAQQPTARTGDIVGALREVLRKRVGATLLSVRGSQGESVTPGVPGYYLLFNYRRNGVEMTALGYFTTLSYGSSSPGWQLYSSGVHAPRAEFPQRLQTMLRMWRSWRPNGRQPREGSSSALFDRILQDSQISHERISREFRALL